MVLALCVHVRRWWTQQRADGNSRRAHWEEGEGRLCVAAM
jgi:hypothetical protein